MTGSEPRTVDADPGRPRHRPAPVRFAMGLALAPAAWVLHFLAGVSLVAVACDQRSDLWLHLTTAVSLPLGLVGLWSALHLRAELRADEGNATLGVVAVALAALSVSLIIVEQLITIPLEPCA